SSLRLDRTGTAHRACGQDRRSGRNGADIEGERTGRFGSYCGELRAAADQSCRIPDEAGRNAATDRCFGKGCSMRIVDLTAEFNLREVDALLKTAEAEERVDDTVFEILQDVRNRGDEAVCEYTKQFDDFDMSPEVMRVPEERLHEYALGADDELVEILKKASHNIREFHEQQAEESWEFYAGDGVRLGVRHTAIDSTGIYIPGGKAAY